METIEAAKKVKDDIYQASAAHLEKMNILNQLLDINKGNRTRQELFDDQKSDFMITFDSLPQQDAIIVQ